MRIFFTSIILILHISNSLYANNYIINKAFFEGNETQFEIDEAKQLKRNIKECNKGNIQACLDAGGSYQYGQEDNPKLFVYYQKACDLNDSYSCWKLGHSYREISYPIDHKNAKKAFLKSCDLGNLQGCIDGGRENFAHKLIYISAQGLLGHKSIIKKVNSLGRTIFCTNNMKLCKTAKEVYKYYYDNLEKVT